MSCIGGLSFVILLVIVNQAAEIVADTSAGAELSLCLIYMGICVVTILCKNYTMNKALLMAEEVVRRVRVRLVDKLRHTELQFMERTKKGEIFARIVQDTDFISQASPGFVNALDAAVSCLAVFIYIAFISMTGFVLALLSIVTMYFVSFFSYYEIKEELMAARLKEADFFDSLNDMLTGFKEIKINAKKNNALFADIETLARESENVKIEAETRYDRNIVFFFGLFMTVLAVIVFVVPLFTPIHGESLVKVVAAVLFILGMLVIVYRGIYTIVKANVAVENLERLEAGIDVFGIHTEAAAVAPGSFREIAFHSVTFQYTGKEEETLFTMGPIDLNIRQGEILFIIGGNGSGKSTLLKLLTGLYYPMAGGEITLDDQSLARKNYQTYRELFSTIFTDFHLFRKLYGLESVDERHIAHFLKEMDIHKKTDYVDGEFSKTDLSTGQRKRLAYIAAILEDKPVYVFDEWAADQDPTFKRHFYEKFLKDLRSGGKTVIAVTHDDRYFDKA
ncbi:cyclic peptide export ABC transporter, partial [Thermodesulfobacteriota bacterium]